MISVIMGVYNGVKTVEKSINSILSSTYGDIEFIICDDASTDGTVAILSQFAQKDNRIKLLFNERNMGLAYSLNRCLENAKGEYIARQDADDVSHNIRLERELDFLQSHKEYGFVGCSARLMHEGQMWGIRRYPRDIDKHLLIVSNQFIHPTLMFRKEVLQDIGGYLVVSETKRCEDYDLLMRLYAKGVIGYNMQECYFDYSENPDDSKNQNLRTRLDEVKVRLKGNKLMKTGLAGRIYAFKPLLLCLLPRKLYVRLRKKRWEELPDAEKRGNASRSGFKQSVYVLSSLVKRNVKTQYRNSILGILWTVLNPLLNMVVLTIVFSQVLGRHMVGIDYPLYVLTGNMVYNLMRAATSSALPSLVDSHELLTKTRISFYVFPTSHVASALVNFLFSLIAMFAVMLVRMPQGVQFYWTIFMIIPFLPSILLFSMGASFVLSALYVHFRDIKHIYNVFLLLWMYMTPIFYSINLLSPKVQMVIKFNPMYRYLEYFRSAVLYGQIPDLKAHLICYGVGILAFVIGALIFRTARKKVILHI
ncbi:glycosyltransferase [bacterium]|nr:glycosyltransferase [bacterium]